MDRLLRAYWRTSSQRQRLLLAADACFQGFWLGVLDREALARIDEHYYRGRRETLGGRAFLYTEDEYNLQGLQDWEAAAVNEHFPAGQRVVVTGAGTGREVYGLLEQGFDAVGYEPNEELLASGRDFLRRHGHVDRLHPSDWDLFPSEVERSGGVVVGWGSYSLIPARDRRIAFLRAARRALPAGAPILVSFFLRVRDARYFGGVAAIANVFRRAARRERVDRGDTLNPYYAHYFVRDEIAAELEAAGFLLVAFEPAPYGHAVARAA